MEINGKDQRNAGKQLRKHSSLVTRIFFLITIEAPVPYVKRRKSRVRQITMTFDFASGWPTRQHPSSVWLEESTPFSRGNCQFKLD